MKNDIKVVRRMPTTYEKEQMEQEKELKRFCIRLGLCFALVCFALLVVS